jgi:hypothetical protein
MPFFLVSVQWSVVSHELLARPTDSNHLNSINKIDPTANAGNYLQSLAKIFSAQSL